MRRKKIERPLAKLRTGEEGYDPVGDQLDALWKGFEAMLAGNPPPSDTMAALERWRAVKARFPKR